MNVRALMLMVVMVIFNVGAPLFMQGNIANAECKDTEAGYQAAKIIMDRVGDRQITPLELINELKGLIDKFKNVEAGYFFKFIYIHGYLKFFDGGEIAGPENDQHLTEEIKLKYAKEISESCHNLWLQEAAIVIIGKSKFAEIDSKMDRIGVYKEILAKINKTYKYDRYVDLFVSAAKAYNPGTEFKGENEIKYSINTQIKVKMVQLGRYSEAIAYAKECLKLAKTEKAKKEEERNIKWLEQKAKSEKK